MRRFLFLLSLFILIFGVAADSWAITDSINVSGTVTTEDDGGGSDPVYGCTDPAATNYNPDATASDGSCQYPTLVPTVMNFEAVYDEDNDEVDLTWVNPSFAEFAAVRIVRSTTFFPNSPNEGTLIYDGPGEEAVDDNVSLGSTYYYTAFVRSTANEYSAGAVAQVTIPTEPPCEGDECDPADPFEDLPEGGGGGFEIGGFIFFQPGEEPQYLRAGGETILLRADKTTTIYLPYDQAPEVLKTIGVTVMSPINPKSSFSFLLRLTPDKKGYAATIAPLGASGKYPVAIYVINYQNQSLKRLTGNLEVQGGAAMVGLVPATIIEQTVAPLVVGTGLLIGLGQALVPLAAVTSWYDIYLIILRALGALSGYFGLRKKYKPWGTVYDAVTKQPIDPAYVTIEANGKEISSAITDIEGRYGFFLPPGTYTLKAGKTHYQFPSAKLAGRSADELYNNLYFGEPFETKPDEVIDRNIPLDPIGFDWNEFVKSQSATLVANSKKELSRARIHKSIYAVGLLTAVGSAVYTPSWLSFSLFGAYVLLAIFERVWGIRRHVRTITWSDTKLPLPFAIVRVSIPDLNQEVKHVVADQLGRFYVLVRPGVYSLSVEEKQADGSYKKVYQSPPTNLPRGTWDSDLKLNRNVLPPEPASVISTPNLTK